MNPPAPVEFFPALTRAGGSCGHAFVGRVPGIDVRTDRPTALRRLEERHRQVRGWLGWEHLPLATAQQVHGNVVAVVPAAGAAPGGPDPVDPGPLPGVDGLVTDRPDVCLGIMVADCCAVYLYDPVRRAVGLVHAGKKGTALGIVPAAVALLGRACGSRPGDLVVQLSPCVRPPHYEVDFAADLAAQCRAAGVTQVFDDGQNTGADLTRYYSYRVEKGQTGRMLALLSLTPTRVDPTQAAAIVP